MIFDRTTGPQLFVREIKRGVEETRRIFGIVRTKGGREGAGAGAVICSISGKNKREM